MKSECRLYYPMTRCRLFDESSAGSVERFASPEDCPRCVLRRYADTAECDPFRITWRSISNFTNRRTSACLDSGFQSNQLVSLSLAVGDIVAALATPHLIAHNKHGHTHRKHGGGGKFFTWRRLLTHVLTHRPIANPRIPRGRDASSRNPTDWMVGPWGLEPQTSTVSR